MSQKALRSLVNFSRIPHAASDMARAAKRSLVSPKLVREGFNLKSTCWKESGIRSSIVSNTVYAASVAHKHRTKAKIRNTLHAVAGQIIQGEKYHNTKKYLLEICRQFTDAYCHYGPRKHLLPHCLISILLWCLPSCV